MPSAVAWRIPSVELTLVEMSTVPSGKVITLVGKPSTALPSADPAAGNGARIRGMSGGGIGSPVGGALTGGSTSSKGALAELASEGALDGTAEGSVGSALGCAVVLSVDEGETCALACPDGMTDGGADVESANWGLLGLWDIPFNTTAAPLSTTATPTPASTNFLTLMAVPSTPMLCSPNPSWPQSVNGIHIAEPQNPQTFLPATSVRSAGAAGTRGRCRTNGS